MMLAGRPGQKPDERASTTGKEGDAEMQDANAEEDEEQQQEQEAEGADGEPEDAAHAEGSMDQERGDAGKVHHFLYTLCGNSQACLHPGAYTQYGRLALLLGLRALKEVI